MSEPLTVLLGAETLRRSRRGIGRHAAEIARILTVHPALRRLLLLDGERVRDASGWDPDEDHDLASGRSAISLGAGLPGARPLRKLADEVRARMLGRRIRASVGALQGAVIYHEPNFLPRPYRGLCTVTVHDLFWREQPNLVPPERLRWIERNLPRLLRQAAGYACVSAFTASELARHIDVEGRPIVVTPNAPGRAFRPIDAATAAPILSRYRLDDRRFVLAVATLEPRKNLERLVEAHAALPARLRHAYPLVIAGGDGWGGVVDRLRGGPGTGRVRLLGYVPDADLPALMGRAALVPLVSLYEGFGLPLTEAMATGTPVLAATGSALEEAAGGAALLVDPLDTDAIRDGLRSLMEDEEAWEQGQARGLVRAAELSWESTVEALVGLWRRCLRS